MTVKELDSKLRELNDLETQVKETPDIKLKAIFSKQAQKEHWIINNEKLMNDSEVISIHKHDRFLEFQNHSHDYLEMMFVYSGKIRHIIEGKAIDVKKGEIIILDMNTEHSILEAGENDIAINILIKKEYFDGYFMKQVAHNDVISNFVIKAIHSKKKIKQFIYFQSSENKQVWNFMISLLLEYYEQKSGMETAIRAYMMLIFNELYRRYEKHLSKSMVKEIDISISGEIIDFIEAHYRDLSLTDMASHFNYHPDYLGKIIKKITGSSLTELVKNRKLEHAKSLLLNTDSPVVDIVNEIGYSNTTYFYKQFKKKFDLTPDQFRKNVKK